MAMDESTWAESGEADLAGDGFRMPPEWHPHTATWVAWPHNNDTWLGKLAAARIEFLQLVEAIARDEPVAVMVGPADEKTLDRAIQSVSPSARPNIHPIGIPTNDAWARDTAPTFVVNPAAQSLAAVDWHYNAWGGKYPPYDLDQQVAREIVRQMPRHWHSAGGIRYIAPSLCLEGGALEIDATGLLLCTRSCALDPNRNAHATLESVTDQLKRTLGAFDVVWLTGDALMGDDTDGHIDQLARFTPTGSILYVWTDDPADPQAAGIRQNRDDLVEGLQRCGRADPLIPLPLPDPVAFDGMRLPASYANFYITNHSVIVPQFGVPQDADALAIIGAQFPNRSPVPLPSRHLTIGLGSFHCLTQQQPSAR